MWKRKFGSDAWFARMVGAGRQTTQALAGIRV
jgi:hypothetical protein